MSVPIWSKHVLRAIKSCERDNEEATEYEVECRSAMKGAREFDSAIGWLRRFGYVVAKFDDGEPCYFLSDKAVKEWPEIFPPGTLEKGCNI